MRGEMCMIYFENSKIYSQTSLTCLAKVFLRESEKKNEQRKNNLRIAQAPSSDPIILLDKTLNSLSLWHAHTHTLAYTKHAHSHTPSMHTYAYSHEKGRNTEDNL